MTSEMRDTQKGLEEVEKKSLILREYLAYLKSSRMHRVSCKNNSLGIIDSGNYS